MEDFSQQTILITGAAGNLGQAIARKFHAAGATLILFDRQPGRLASVFSGLSVSPSHLLEAVDLNDVGGVEAAVARAVERFGRLDVLVNAVGGYRGGAPLHETPVDDWDFLFALNARTVYTACRAAIPYMLRAGKGRIINVAARAALQGAARLAAYSASKSAVVRLTESLAAELKETGINVNCVLPGTIDTPENRQASPSADYSRWVSPEAIADVILFLASPAARAVSGAAIPVYGRS